MVNALQSDSSSSNNTNNQQQHNFDRNPTRIDLDRRKLRRCMKIKGEEASLELINYQHNIIERIEYLNGFKNLVFLDLYDNRLTEISGLDDVPNLRVLMLGKNQIKRISGLENLTKLDILDLHSNGITKIENMSRQKELRILNLSGNALHSITGISVLENLLEANLRRNRLSSMEGIGNLKSLQRLFVSYNEIVAEDALFDALIGCHAVTELTLDGNPVCNDSHYKTTILKCLPNLKQLDMRRISDGERKIIERAIAKEAEKAKKNDERIEKEEDRQLRIEAAMRDWQDQNQELATRTHSALELESERTVLFGTSKPMNKEQKKSYAEIFGNTLRFYGKRSLSALSKNWGYQALSSVTEVKFKFIDFTLDIAKDLPQLRTKFPRTDTLIFSYTNFSNFQQLHSLLIFKKLKKLVITPNGNPLKNFNLFEAYICYAIAKPLGLSDLNNKPISDEAINKAGQLFNGVNNCLYHRPNSTLKSIILNTCQPPTSDSNNKKSQKIYTPSDSMKVDEAEFMKLLSKRTTKMEHLTNSNKPYHSRIRKLVDSAWTSATRQLKIQRQIDEQWSDVWTNLLESMS